MSKLLRWDSPVQVDGRAAFEELEIDGHVLPAGANVLTLLGAANRDPSHWTEPNRFDVSRNEGPPMSFGISSSSPPSGSVIISAPTSSETSALSPRSAT